MLSSGFTIRQGMRDSNVHVWLGSYRLSVVSNDACLVGSYGFKNSTCRIFSRKRTITGREGRSVVGLTSSSFKTTMARKVFVLADTLVAPLGKGRWKGFNVL